MKDVRTITEKEREQQRQRFVVRGAEKKLRNRKSGRENEREIPIRTHI